MKKLFTTLLLATVSLMSFAQQEWIDVTDKYLINPRFDNNDRTTGWSGTEFSAYNPWENAEHYGKNYDSYQDIEGLPAGKYRVILNAFYRMGDTNSDYNKYSSGNYSQYQHAQLYATSSINDYSTPIVPLCSGMNSYSLGGSAKMVGGHEEWDWEAWSYITVGGSYVPDNMEAAYYWFNAGKYKNTVECQVGSDNKLKIGIRKQTTISDDWTCLDDWTLECWGTVNPVTTIELSENDIELSILETYYLTATTYPTDATYRNVNWESTDASIATVNSKGEIQAVGFGTCYIKAIAKDGKGAVAQCKVTVVKNEPTAENIIINELMAANVDVYRDPSQNYGSWVELYNPTDKGVSLAGLYVTDDEQNLTKHRLRDDYESLPPHGFAMLHFDHFEVWTPYALYQIDDKLDCDGGKIFITDGKKIIAQQEYPKAISRISYARTTDGGDTWMETGAPSPGYSNEVNGGFATDQVDAPIVDKDGQLFQGNLQICVNIPAGATLKYTTDGTTPTLDNGQVSETGLFNIDYTTCFRFRLFKDGYLPSAVVTRTYLYNNGNEPFPIISVVTDPEGIYSTEYGVFSSGGPYGRPGNGKNYKCNWNMDWDRPVSFEYITTDNECLVSQECDFSACGGWSRGWDPHSFKLKATKTYDLQNSFPVQFFAEKPYLKNKTLQIRNGGNDSSCRIKDAALQQIVARSGIDIDYQSWQPVHVYINGSSHAVINMREPNNKDYAYANYGIDTDEMDQFEISPDSGYVQKRGTDEAFLRLVSLSAKATNESTYEEICQLVDMNEFINYMAAELYLSGNDWPRNNVKGFRDQNNGKFRFVLFDLDGAFGSSNPFDYFFGREYHTFDRLYGINYATGENIDGTSLTLQIKLVTMFKNLLQNATFRKRFIDTYSIMGGSVFQPDKVQSIVDEMSNYLSQGGYVDPRSTANNLKSTLTASYNSNRMTQLKERSEMKLSTTAKITANLSVNHPDAKIMLNDIEIPYSRFNGYVFAPAKIKAVAPAGYRFVGWSKPVDGTQATLFAAGTKWSYYDGGSLDGEDWTAKNYDITGWKSGSAIIGYDYNNMHPDITTSDVTGNLSTYYFRKTFNVTNTPASTDVYTLDFTIDDGMVVYVNGHEAGRYNMPSGTVKYDTFASSYAPDNPDTGTLELNPSFFQKGSNVIAVEVHNNSTGSTDIMWNASLTVTTESSDGSTFVSTNEEYTLPLSGTQKLRACFEQVSEEEMLAEGITPVRINEVGAANSMYVNDYFKKNDWIELYNTTDEDIDIAGMYISDNVKKPNKYQVPSNDATLNTIIPARGFKIIWCDKLNNTTEIHTNFKLEAAGGDVIISTKDYNDVLTYDVHTGIQSFGRYPDGFNDTYVMNIPTIAESNQIGFYDTLYIAPQPEPDEIRSYTKEGGITIAYVGGVVNVKSEDSPIRQVNIYNTSGLSAKGTQFSRSNDHFVSVAVSTLPRGIYIATATTEDGDECHIKFIIK